MSYYVYVLKSLKDDIRYIGYTKRSINEKLSEHNIKISCWTSNHKPWKLVYYEEFKCIKCAINREKFFKTGYGRKLLDVILDANIFNL